MPAPSRVLNFVFILVPSDGTSDNVQSIRAAQRTCRIAHHMKLQPISPLLYHMTYLSKGELSMELRGLSMQWLRRTDRIWLQFPSADCHKLDPLTYDILYSNNRLGPRHNNCVGRRPVYRLEEAQCDKIGYVPKPMSKDEVKQLLYMNLTVGLSRCCL